MTLKMHAREAKDVAPAAQAGEGSGEVPARALQAQMIPVAKLRESPFNPRRRRDKTQDAELLDSVRKHGVLQPVLARPWIDGTDEYELVVGHRRRQAAIEAGLSEIPATVRHIPDVEVLEIQLVENRQRADVDPLDEAKGFRRLHAEHGKSIDEIAAKVGVSRGTVYARLKLLELAKPVRALLAEGKLDASRALLLARIPTGLQEKAAKEITKPRWNDEPLSYRAARAHIESDYMLRLGEAPWKLDDAELVSAAGPCTTCPKRSGNQKELFDAGEAKDLCMDGACFKNKRVAHHERLLAAAEAKGATVLRGKPAKAVIDDYGSLRDQSYVKLDSTCHEDPKYRTYRALLKKADVERVVVANERHGVVELVPKAGLKAALKKAGHDFAKKVGAHVRTDDSWKRRQEIERRAEQLFLEALLPKASDILEAGPDFWRPFVLAQLGHGATDTDAIAKRRGLTFKKYESEAAIEQWVPGASLAELHALALELILGRDYDGDLAAHVAKLADLDRTAFDRQAKDAIAAEAKAKREAAKDSKKKAKPKKGAEFVVPTCRKCGCTDDDCSQCVEKTGEPCAWIEPDLCSACAPASQAAKAKRAKPKKGK